MNMLEYRVVIKHYTDEEYRVELDLSHNLRSTRAVEKGANINLNTESYYTVIETLENGEVVDDGEFTG